MQPMMSAVPAIAVSMIYCLWNYALRHRQQRARRLRERVAYMLWVMATEID
jgi:hypothetical protein